MWKEIFRVTKNFTLPTKFLPPIEFPISHDDVDQMLKGASTDNRAHVHNFFRGFQGGLEKYGMVDEIWENQKKDLFFRLANSIPMKRGEMGIIINGGLQWHRPSAEKIKTYTKNLGLEIPDQLFRIDLTFFAGDYGFTPLGVHLDPKSYSTIIFNMGPGDKEVWLWDFEVIKKSYGHRLNIFDVNAIDQEPQITTLSEGEAFFLPPNFYHTCRNKSFSLSASLVIDRPKIAKLLSEEILVNNELIDNFFSKNKFDVLEVLATASHLRLLSNSNLRFGLAPRKIPSGRRKSKNVMFFEKNMIRVQYINNYACIIFSRGCSQYIECDARRVMQGFEKIPEISDFFTFLNILKGEKIEISNIAKIYAFLYETGTIEVD